MEDSIDYAEPLIHAQQAISRCHWNILNRHYEMAGHDARMAINSLRDVLKWIKTNDSQP